MLTRFHPVSLVFAVLLAGCEVHVDDESIGWGGREQEEFQYTYDFKPGNRLMLENYNGAIEVEGWEQPKIEIRGVKYAPTKERLKDVKIDVARGDSGVTIRTVPPGENRGNTGAKYQIRMPKQAVIEFLKSTNGSVQVRTMEGPATIRTTNGSVKVSGVKGDVTATTTNGSMEIVDVRGVLALRSTNGRIKLEEIRGGFEATTTNGGIDAELRESLPGRNVRLSTTNGGVDLRVPQGFKNDIRVSTSNGSIDVQLPSGSNFAVSARTTNSSIKSDFDISGDVEKKRIEGRMGAGGPLLDLSTSSGSIRIQKVM